MSFVTVCRGTALPVPNILISFLSFMGSRACLFAQFFVILNFIKKRCKITTLKNTEKINFGEIYNIFGEMTLILVK
jgi:hypothetical protein